MPGISDPMIRRRRGRAPGAVTRVRVTAYYTVARPPTEHRPTNRCPAITGHAGTVRVLQGRSLYYDS
eukprot:588284-Hanusia_phi.AAC.1